MENTEHFGMRCSAAMLESLDRVRAMEPGIPTRAEMIRRLIERAELALAGAK